MRRYLGAVVDAAPTGDGRRGAAGGEGSDSDVGTNESEIAPGRAPAGPRPDRVRHPGRLSRLAVARRTVRIGVAVAAVLGCLLGVAVTFPGLVARHLAPPLVYFPADLSAERSAPAVHGLPRGEEVRLRTSDGVRLHAWWVPPAGGPGCGALLFLHGNAGHLADRAFLARRVAETGRGIFLLDYRGYGLSEGTPDEEGLQRDARAAHRWLVDERGVAPERLVVAGHSLGSAVAARLAVERPAAGLVLTGAFRSVPELGAELYGWLPDALFRGWPTERFETEARAREVGVPALVARGGRDRVVPRAQTRAVHEALPDDVPSVWHEAPLAGHGDLWDDDEFWDALRPFLERVVPCPGDEPG